ncbi:MAG: M56 family metallopeptidase [Defluviitaleaceae bacterium]|nr:M56 family metallopeptidase [Defluviitaleaceae bacterium]MCL2262743.1 M56 family metallopeptidase [Defluviitaleaceae bacterium]
MSQFVVNILWVSVVCGVFILGIWALSPILSKHFNAKWKYWVWILIALRLVVPINFGLPQFTAPAGMSEVMAIQNMPVAELFAPLPIPSQADTTEPPVYSAHSLMESIAIYQVLFLVWFVGGIAFAAVQAARYFIVKRKILRWSAVPKRHEIDETISKLSMEMGINAAIFPMVNKGIASPMIMGLIRPVLMLPHEDYESNELTFILRHELTHFKNKDIVYKVVLFIANAIHWFNPIVYLMVQEAHADMERVCDDAVLENSGTEERREYGEVILNSIGQQKMRGNVFTTNFYAGTNKIKARFTNIMDVKKKKSGFVQLLVIAFAAVILSGIRPVMGYPTETANAIQPSDFVHSHIFTAMMVDSANIDILDIHLPYANLMVATNDYIAPGTQVFISGTTLGNVFTINPATRTAYIRNNTQLPEGFGYYEESILSIVVSGESDWVFEQANIHLENGDIWYIHAHINEFLAENLNVSLPQGSVLKHVFHTDRVLIEPSNE